MHNKFLGFTLAETLITLVIIGVVAALTVPTLLNYMAEEKTVSQLSKAYTTIAQAWLKATQEYGPISTWGLESTSTGRVDENGEQILNRSAQQIAAERLRKYLSVSKVCKTTEICDSRPEYNMSGVKTSDGDTAPVSADGITFYLSDGTKIVFGYYSASINNIDIAVTLPGKKIITGKTFFYFNATDFKVSPEGHALDTVVPFNKYCKTTSIQPGRGCTAWVIYNKNMDYLHCPNELGWGTKIKC